MTKTPQIIPNGGALVRFLALTFALGIALQLMAIRFGQGWLLATMWAPAIAAALASPETRRLAWLKTKKSGWRWLWLGLLLGLAPTLVKTILLAVFNRGKWDSQHLELASDGHSIKAIHHLGVILGHGPQSFAFLGMNLLVSVAIGATIVALIGGIGEEIGWRGVLQPTFEARYGRFRGTVLVGLVWAYWHLPVNLRGYNDPVHPLLTSLVLFPIGLVAISFLLAWITRRSGSVWPSALAHGANNAVGATLLLTATSWRADSAAMLVGYVLVGAVFAARTLKNGKPAAIRPCDPVDASSTRQSLPGLT